MIIICKGTNQLYGSCAAMDPRNILTNKTNWNLVDCIVEDALGRTTPEICQDIQVLNNLGIQVFNLNEDMQPTTKMDLRPNGIGIGLIFESQEQEMLFRLRYL